MPEVLRAGFRLHYEVLGDPAGVPLVLVAGSGEQIGSVEFPAEQCALFVARGFRVVRLDNRDAGLSVPLEPLPDIDIADALARGTPAPYTRLDMADDVIAVLDALGIPAAHLVGASMGGFIVRWAAVRHPSRVASLAILMSGAGGDAADPAPQWERAALERLLVLARVLPRAEAIDSAFELWRFLWGDGYPFEEAFVRERVTHAHDRSYRPQGFARHALSSVRSPGLWRAQQAIRCPTLILQGGRDPLFARDHGGALQSRITDSVLWFDPRMGHAIHRELWEELADRVSALAATANAG
ncbi:MAG: alpha/beta hydrolase [Gammaproteobacteria bacterium]|nr:alpha/beta hydrolase [Gammaproteobacteria bacterium]